MPVVYIYWVISNPNGFIQEESGIKKEASPTYPFRKALTGLEPRYRRKKDPPSPIMGAVATTVESWLKGDRERPRKQRHTARRVYTRLVAEHGFTGPEATVRRWVRECRSLSNILSRCLLRSPLAIVRPPLRGWIKIMVSRQKLIRYKRVAI